MNKKKKMELDEIHLKLRDTIKKLLHGVLVDPIHESEIGTIQTIYGPFPEDFKESTFYLDGILKGNAPLVESALYKLLTKGPNMNGHPAEEHLGIICIKMFLAIIKLAMSNHSLNQISTSLIEENKNLEIRLEELEGLERGLEYFAKIVHKKANSNE